MRKIAILATLVASIMGGCAVNEVNTLTQTESLPNLSAGFAESATKTYVENNKYLRWHEDDRLTAFYGNALNRQYKFNGSTGANSGTFSLVPNGELGTGNTLNAIYAVYPYDETATITDEGVISLTLPATQLYAENSFGKNANTMIAVTENLEDTFLAFKNACGYLKLKLYNADGVRIKSIEVKGNNGEKIAGKATATMEFGGEPSLVMADDTTESITLDCGDGVLLGTTAETATEFWFVVPETTFERGITISVKDELGGKFEKSTTNKVIISRNEIQPMVALNADAFVGAIPNNEIGYTSTDGNIVTPYAGAKFGANIISNTYENGKGVIKFDGNVTKIGYKAFHWCSSLTSVTIPDSVTEIGSYAFSDCTSLTSVTIPDSVTSIGSDAFYRCTSLTSITIPNSVTSIGSDAFYNCTSLPIVNGIQYADTYLVGAVDKTQSSYDIKEGTRFIGNSAFDICKSLTSVTIPDSVTSIGNSAFWGCTSLTSITIGDSVTLIGENAFSYCDSLKSVTIPDSVTSIGEYAFRSCSSLTGVIIPNSVIEIGGCAFSECTSLTSVTIGNSVTSIGNSVFSGCSSLTSVTIPNSVTSIGEYAFHSCSSLTSVIIPNSVAEIGHYAFRDCSSLASVTIPDSVTSIGHYAFYYCSRLISVTIGSSVTSIMLSFYECPWLTTVYCKPTIPPTGGGGGFGYYPRDGSPDFVVPCKIYVPRNSVSAYKSASGWSEYANYIEGYDF